MSNSITTISKTSTTKNLKPNGCVNKSICLNTLNNAIREESQNRQECENETGLKKYSNSMGYTDEAALYNDDDDDLLMNSISRVRLVQFQKDSEEPMGITLKVCLFKF